jgi:hypothetical protein
MRCCNSYPHAFQRDVKATDFRAVVTMQSSGPGFSELMNFLDRLPN